MVNIKKNRNRRKIVPIGIFMMLFIIESIIATLSVGAYFLFKGKNGVDDIERYTRNYSVTMAEAFSDVASLSYKSGRYRNLRLLFHKKIGEDTIDEAFFVLKNGKLIAHSDRSVEKQLRGNIANDEFAYNIDMILMPAKKRKRRVQFSDYNLINQKRPSFSFPLGKGRDHIKFLKEHIYKDIDSPGWLVSKAVFVRKKAVGTVNFIISKKRIFIFIESHLQECLKVFVLSIIGVFLISLAVSIIVAVRYRRIESDALREGMTDGPAPFISEEEELPEIDLEAFEDEPVSDTVIIPELYLKEEKTVSVSGKDEIETRKTKDDFVTFEYLGSIDDVPELTEEKETRETGKAFAEQLPSEVTPVVYDEQVESVNSQIRDAIPVTRKR